jgi:hypothetical protein
MKHKNGNISRTEGILVARNSHIVEIIEEYRR